MQADSLVVVEGGRKAIVIVFLAFLLPFLCVMVFTGFLSSIGASPIAGFAFLALLTAFFALMAVFAPARIVLYRGGILLRESVYGKVKVTNLGPPMSVHLRKFELAEEGPTYDVEVVGVKGTAMLECFGVRKDVVTKTAEKVSAFLDVALVDKTV